MNEDTFTPDVDIWEDYLDGSGRVCVAEAGKPIRWSFAYQLGLVAVPVKPQGKVEKPRRKSADVAADQE